MLSTDPLNTGHALISPFTRSLEDADIHRFLANHQQVATLHKNNANGLASENALDVRVSRLIVGPGSVSSFDMFTRSGHSQKRAALHETDGRQWQIRTARNVSRIS